MANRIQPIVTILILACFALSIVACGDGETKTKKKSTRTKSKAKVTKSGGLGPTGGTVDLGQAGVIKGVVKFSGTAPTPKAFDISNDKFCEMQSGVTDETLVVGANGSLRDVLVYVEGLEDYASEFEVPTKAARIVQQGCQYRPHVLAVRVDQDVNIVNADNTTHNYHFIGRANDEINRTQAKPETNVEVFTAPEIGGRIGCDIHPWMSAVVHVMDHPCFAVSAADGSFTINGVPPGNYKLRFVHAAAKTTQDGISIKMGANGQLNLKDVSFTQ